MRPEVKGNPHRSRAAARRIFEQHFLRSSDTRTAARAAGVSERTGHRWKEDVEARVAAGALRAPGVPVTTFVGRQAELKTLAEWLRSERRLITVIGPPGMGKTRLARELVDSVIVRRVPTVFGDLREAITPWDLCLVVGRELDLPFVSGEEGATTAHVSVAGALLAHGESVLLLDNADRLAPNAAAVVGQWIRANPRLRVIVTSRRPLHLEGESLFDLGPLPIPVDGGDWSSDAMRLFWERATGIEPSFSRSTRQPVASLVRALEGVPLAIELAAGQMRRVGPRELLEQIQVGADDFASACVDVESRHASLDSAVEGSWQLLSLYEQAALSQLTLFSRGFSLEAARHVIALPDDASIDEVVGNLRDASLIRVADEPDPAGGTRWDLYVAIARFASNRLGPEDARGTAARHAAFFLRWGEEWVRRLRSPEGPLARQVLGLELDNLRTGFEWLATTSPSPRQAARMGLVIYQAVHRRMPGLAVPALSTAARLLEEAKDDKGVLYARICTARGRAYSDLGEQTKADADFAVAAPLLPLDEPFTLEHAYESARRYFVRGEHAEARRGLEQAILEAEARGARHVEARLRRLLARALAEVFLNSSAFHHLARSAYLLEQLGDVCELTHTRLVDCVHRVFFGREITEGEFNETIAAADRHARHYAIMGLTVLGLLHQERGNLEQARECYERARERAAVSGLRSVEGLAWFRLATCDEEEGRLGSARHGYERAVDVARDAGETRFQAKAELFLAGLMADRGELEEASPVCARARASIAALGESGYGELAGLIAARVERARHVSRGGDRCHTGGFDFTRCGEWAAALSASCELRLALRLTERSSRTVTASPLRVTRDGSAFRLGVHHEVALPSGPILRRCLLALAMEASEVPGSAVKKDRLIEACWPGERVMRSAAAKRVRETIRRLRRLGLSEVIQTTADGYGFRRSVEIRWVEAFTHTTE